MYQKAIIMANQIEYPTPLLCPKCGEKMKLQNSFDGPLPSGTATSLEYLNVNSTGVSSAFHRWNVYVCPACGYDCDSTFKFADGN